MWQIARAAVAALVLLVGLSVQLPPAAADHSWQTYFPPLSNWPGWNTAWPFDSMSVQFTPSFPNNQLHRDRVQEAHINWPQGSTGRPPVYFYMAGSDWSPTSPCAQGDNVNGVHYRNLTDAYARTNTCRGLVGHWNAQMTFDSDRTWYVSNAQPGTSTLDLEGVATHEFGHLYGWTVHYTSAQPICTTNPRHTMCPGTNDRTYDRRTTKAHDRSTMWGGFLNQYPA